MRQHLQKLFSLVLIFVIESTALAGGSRAEDDTYLDKVGCADWQGLIKSKVSSAENPTTSQAVRNKIKKCRKETQNPVYSCLMVNEYAALLKEIDSELINFSVIKDEYDQCMAINVKNVSSNAAAQDSFERYVRGVEGVSGAKLAYAEIRNVYEQKQSVAKRETAKQKRQLRGRIYLGAGLATLAIGIVTLGLGGKALALHNQETGETCNFGAFTGPCIYDLRAIGISGSVTGTLSTIAGIGLGSFGVFMLTTPLPATNAQ